MRATLALWLLLSGLGVAAVAAQKSCPLESVYTAPAGTISTTSTGNGKYSDQTTCLFSIRSDLSNLAEQAAAAGLPLYITATFTQMDIECGWDYMRVYEGGVVNGSVIAALTGDVLPEPIVTTAKELLFYFRTDYAANGAGLRANYRIALCPYNCHAPERGTCNNGVCECAPAYTGIGCEREVCPNNCSLNGICDQGRGRCLCATGHKGADCSVALTTPMWRNELHPSAPRVLVSARGQYSPELDLYVAFGGHRPDGRFAYSDVVAFNFTANMWVALPSSGAVPTARGGHVAVLVNASLYVMGGERDGRPVDGLYEYDLTTNVWTEWPPVPASELGAAPGALYLHAGAYVPPLHAILVAGGRDLPNDITSRVFLFDLATHTWRILPTSGGHQAGFYSSVLLYDARMDRMIAVGGVQTSSAFTAYISNTWTLSPYTGAWAPLATTLGPGVTYERLMRYSHAGAIVGDHVVIYGGGAYDEAAGRSACFSPSMFALNLVCRVWSEVQYAYTSARSPLWSAGPLGVLSHDLLARRNLLYVVGGTNGRASRAVSVLEHDRCAWWATPQACAAQEELSCEWLSGLGCREANRVGQDHLGALQTANATTLLPLPASCGAPCDQFATADACDRNWASYGCVWCAANSTCLAAAAAAPDGSVPADIVVACARDEACFAAWSNTTVTPGTCPGCLGSSSEVCQWCPDVQACLPVNGTATCAPAPEAEVCLDACQGNLDCASCTANAACGWCSGTSTCANRERACPTDAVTVVNTMEFSCGSVRPSCAERTTCEDCLSVRGYGCLWCTNPPTCMRADAYPARFPVGQCHNYTQDAPHICPLMAANPVDRCAGFKSCAECTAQPMCGWCPHAGNSPNGSCMYGTWQGPAVGSCPANWRTSLTSSFCIGAVQPTPTPTSTTSPNATTTPGPLLCACNGHSAQCDPQNPTWCTNCLDGTMNGEMYGCELCKPGWVGSAAQGSNCIYILGENTRWSETILAGRRLLAQTKTTIPDSMLFFFTITSGAPVVYLSDADVEPREGHYQIKLTTSTSRSGLALTNFQGVMYIAVHADRTSTFQIEYALTSSTSVLFATSSVLLWLIVVFIGLMALIFFAVFLIKARQYRRFRARRWAQPRNMMLSPQVFNLADMATLKRVSVAGDADPADLKDIVENRSLAVYELPVSGMAAAVVLLRLPSAAETLDLADVALGHLPLVQLDADSRKDHNTPRPAPERAASSASVISNASSRWTQWRSTALLRRPSTSPAPAPELDFVEAPDTTPVDVWEALNAHVIPQGLTATVPPPRRMLLAPEVVASSADSAQSSDVFAADEFA